MKKFGLAALAATVAIVTSGCAGAGDAIIGNRNPRVRLVNAFPATNVDASLTDKNGTQNVMTNAAFGDFTTEFIPENGDNTVTFSQTGGGQLVTRTSLYELNHDYTVVGYGGPGARNVLIASDAASPLFGQTAFRVMNVSGGDVDVYIGASGSTLATATKIRDNLSSGAIFPYHNTDAGTSRIFITGSNNTVIQSQEDFTMENGKTYTLIVASNPGPVLFKINSF